MPRVLIVSPRFAPSNAADTHRIRLLLPYLRSEGIEAEVLAVDSRDVPAPIDEWLEARLPSDVPVHRVRAWPLKGWGLQGLAQRALMPLLNAGSRLLSSRDFDLVVFSTTEFFLQLLGPLWKARHGVPFCLDLQDPWVSDYFRQNPLQTPPGGRLKFRIADRLSRIAERAVVPRAAGFISVSASYVRDLDARYGPSTSAIPRIVLPFPGEPAELNDVRSKSPAHGQPNRPFVWRYVGIASAQMTRAMRTFFNGWSRARNAQSLFAREMRLEAYGTTYAMPSQHDFSSSIAPLAREFGLDGQIDEFPARIGYHDMLHKIATADGLVVFGSDDPSYTASKLYPYLLAGKPLMVICHKRSSIVEVMRVTAGGECIQFSEGDLDMPVERVTASLSKAPSPIPLQMAGFEQFTAGTQARTVASWLRTHVLGSSAH